MKSFDFILEPDLNIIDGDLVIEESDNYNVMYTLVARKGQLYRHPDLGVNFQKFEKAKVYDGRQISRDVLVEMEVDGYEVNS